MRKAARAIPQVWSKTFLIGIVLLENIQAVKELVSKRLMMEVARQDVGQPFRSRRGADSLAQKTHRRRAFARDEF
jgi:hypothetical protein